MNDPVDRILVEREAMDRGFPAGVILSITAHMVLIGGSLLAAVLTPAKPLIDVVDGIAVPLPRGGGGSPTVDPPAPAPQAPEPAPTAPPPEPEAPKPEPVKPQVIKPPREEPKKGLPEPDAKPLKKKPTPTPVPGRSTGGVPGGTGTSTQTPGLEFGPPGPGVPGGTDMFGDWYLASVQRKIWLLWTQQIQPDFRQPVTVRFTILGDGSVVEPNVVQSSGISLIDRAALRAIQTAAPFGPLPKAYGTDRYTIQAVFRPTS